MNSATQDKVRAMLGMVDALYPTKSAGDLLTIQNPKTLKGAESAGYIVGIVHLAAASLSGANVCTWSVNDCVAGCLTYAGQGGIGLDASGLNRAQAARIRRTARAMLWGEAFGYDLRQEVTRLQRKANSMDLRVAIRLNGTSDIPWHRRDPDLVAWMRDNGIQQYEYTKRPVPDARDHGIDTTYSYPGGKGIAAQRHLDAGNRVAVVFDTPKGHALPTEWQAPWGDTLRVIDGDKSDLRFLEPGGVVVGIRAKGRLKGKTGTRDGFLVAAA